MTNDTNARDQAWRRLPGDDWDSYDALPEPVRRRLQQHAYDPWPVNTLHLWRAFRRKRGGSAPALVTLMRHIDSCERQERDRFAAAWTRLSGTELPHLAARATVQRY